MSGRELVVVEVPGAEMAVAAEPAAHVSPLAGIGWLHGGVVEDLVEIEAIRARVTRGALPWWRRAVTRAPAGWPR